MSPQTKHHIATSVHWGMLIIALIAIFIGYLKLDTTQTQLKDQQVQIKAAAARRAHDQCVTLKKSQKPFVAAVEFFTQPADLTGLTPERLVVVQEVNRQRAEARTTLLANVPVLHCGQR